MYIVASHLSLLTHSDGIGRSGAFICIHSQLESLKTEGEVDVFNYVKMARSRRTRFLSKLVNYH